MLAGAYLRAGMGGLVLCAKPEEVGLWISYARANGRANSVVIFDESKGFNFLAYETARQGARGIGSIVDCLMRILEAADLASGITGNSSDAFWPQSIRQALNYAIPLIYAANGTLTVADIIDFVTTAATKPEQYLDQQWCKGSFAAQTLRKSVDAPAVPFTDERQQKELLSYWFHQWPAVPDKTRGNVVISISAKLDRFRHGRLRDCFCGYTNIVPEITFHGAIIIMNMPALTWNEDGIIGQQLFKYMFQRAVESRNGLDPSQSARPVYIWADESHYFCAATDESFLSTCRGSRCCVVYMTQTLPTYYARMGKDKTDAADGLVGKFSTQIFHLNACNRTNTMASQLIGRGIHHRANQSRSTGTNINRGMNENASTGRGDSTSAGTSYGHNQGSSSHNTGTSSNSGESWGANVGRGTSENTSSGTSEQMDYLVEPNFFATGLKSGGPQNNNEVSALWFKAGAKFQAAGGANHLITTFRQSR